MILMKNNYKTFLINLSNNQKKLLTFLKYIQYKTFGNYLLNLLILLKFQSMNINYLNDLNLNKNLH